MARSFWQSGVRAGSDRITLTGISVLADHRLRRRSRPALAGGPRCVPGGFLKIFCGAPAIPLRDGRPHDVSVVETKMHVDRQSMRLLVGMAGVTLVTLGLLLADLILGPFQGPV